MFAASKSGSVDAKDAQFNYVTMLLHGNGTNGAQNNTFLDSSTNNFSITRNGNTTQGTFTPYGSNWSTYTNATSTYFTSGTSAVFGFGTGDWTFEFFINSLSFTDNQFIVDFRPSGSAGSTYPWIYLTTTGVLNYGTAGAVKINSSAGAVTGNTWTHVAVSKASGSTRMFVNGVQVGSTYTDSNDYGSSARFVSGTFGDAPGGGSGTGFVQGYLSNLRILKGTGLYTGSYTVPTSPLTAITNTSCLTFQSNRWVDNSGNSISITPSGSPSVQRFSPFSPTTAYSTSVIGGSGYFDGSGDFLSMANNSAFSPSTGDFTLEGWAYHTTASGSNNMYFAQGTGGLALYRNTSGQLELAQDAVAVIITSSATIPSNAWTHVAASRSGTTLKLFINGTQTASATNSTSFSGSASEYVGISGNGSSFPMFGYISDIRLCKSALYTATFTPNTSPLTITSQSATNCQFLTNYTNAGILDNAMMNDLETVGNAQISTSVKKYGTGSLAFDGTGDWLQAVSTPQADFGSGNFTLECWAYLNNFSTDYRLMAKVVNISSYGSWQVLVDTSGYPRFYASSAASSWDVANGTGGGIAISTSTWAHIAVTRSGSTITMWVNGVSAGTSTSSASLYYSASVPVTVGGMPDGTRSLNGNLDEVRITKGVARYTSTFTPSTTAFADKG